MNLDSDLNEDSDRAAMQRLVDGEDLALNEIMERWQPRLIRFLIRLTGNPTAAVDLAEETFVQVYQSRNRFRSSAVFSTWLFAIATNLFRNQARWQRRHPTVRMEGDASDGEGATTGEFPHPQRDPSQLSAAREKAEAVRNAVLTLPEDHRQVIVLFAYEGLSHRAISEIVGCSVKAVEARLYRARATLRQQLRTFLGEDPRKN